MQSPATKRSSSSTVISSPGVLTGWVSSVAGAFPEGGAEGNISGVGWGFFTVSYSDDAGVFAVEVSD